MEKSHLHNAMRWRLIGPAIALAGALATGAIIHPWQSDKANDAVRAMASASPTDSLPDDPRVIISAPSPNHAVLSKPTLSDPTAERLITATDKLPPNEQLSVLIGKICTLEDDDGRALSLYGSAPNRETADDLATYYDWRYAVTNGHQNAASNEGGTLPHYYIQAMNETCPGVPAAVEK